MKKVLIYLSAILFTILVFAAIAVTVLCQYIDPNDFKPLIAGQLKKVIKREVSIDGNLTWAFFPEFGVRIERLSISSATPKTDTSKISIADASVNVRLMPLFHRQIDISGIGVSGVDMPQYHIKEAVFHADNVKLNAAFPATLAFDYVVGKSVVKVDMSGRVQLDDAHQTLSWRDIKIHAANIDCAGDVNVTNIRTSPMVKAAFSVEAKDLSELLKLLGSDAGDLQAAERLHGNIQIATNQDKVDLRGDLNVGSLQIKDMRLSQVRIPIRFANGNLSFNPITARFYEGSLTSQINVDINTGQPNITAAARINGMHTKDLWRDLNGGHPKISIETMGDMSFQVKTVGMNSSMLIRHMNGSGSIDFKQGVISGIDLKAVIESAYALIKKQPSNRSGNSDQSRFDSVSGNIAIRNGILQSENLTLDSPDFSTLGNGRVDLPSQWINYIFHTRVKKAVSGRNNDWTNLYGIAIPIAVRGKLNDPAISLDAGQLLKAIAEKQLNAAGDDAKAQLKNKILEQVPGQAGELLNSLTR